MRKLWPILLAGALLLPAAAFAERVAAGDGSLVLNGASGRLSVSGHGLIFGHLDRGTITVVGDYKPDDNTALPSVSGAKMKVIGSNVVYTGTDVRFLFPGGRYSLVLEGAGIDLSAVGTGKLAAAAGASGAVTSDGGVSRTLDTLLGTLVFGRGNAATAGSAGLGNGKGKNG